MSMIDRTMRGTGLPVRVLYGRARGRRAEGLCLPGPYRPGASNRPGQLLAASAGLRAAVRLPAGRMAGRLLPRTSIPVGSARASGGRSSPLRPSGAGGGGFGCQRPAPPRRRRRLLLAFAACGLGACPPFAASWAPGRRRGPAAARPRPAAAAPARPCSRRAAGAPHAARRDGAAHAWRQAITAQRDDRCRAAASRIRPPCVAATRRRPPASSVAAGSLTRFRRAFRTSCRTRRPRRSGSRTTRTPRRSQACGRRRSRALRRPLRRARRARRPSSAIRAPARRLSPAAPSALACPPCASSAWRGLALRGDASFLGPASCSGASLRVVGRGTGAAQPLGHERLRPARAAAARRRRAAGAAASPRRGTSRRARRSPHR